MRRPAAPTGKQAANLTGKWTGTLTRTAPDGRSQSIDFMFDLTHKGKVLTGTAGPNAERQWAIEKGAVDAEKVTFRVQQPDGPMRTFTLKLVKDRLRGHARRAQGPEFHRHSRRRARQGQVSRSSEPLPWRRLAERGV